MVNNVWWNPWEGEKVVQDSLKWTWEWTWRLGWVDVDWVVAWAWEWVEKTVAWLVTLEEWWPQPSVDDSRWTDQASLDLLVTWGESEGDGELLKSNQIKFEKGFFNK